MKSLLMAPTLPTGASFGVLAVRFVVGAAFMLHGWPKMQNPLGWMGPDAGMPGILQAAAAVSEFGGGFCWIVGLLTRVVSPFLAITMAVAVATHVGRGQPFVGKGGSYELALVYLSVALLLTLAGAGRWSLDALWLRPRSE